MKKILVVAGGLVLAAGLATPVSAKTYTPGDNPMCLTNTDGVAMACLKADETSVTLGQIVTFISKESVFDPGEKICAARARKGPYSAYDKINACMTAGDDGAFRLRVDLGRTGKQWIDIGSQRCLNKPPKQRSPKKCGDNGGVQSTPIRITVR